MPLYIIVGGMFAGLWSALKFFYTNYKARFVKEFRTREVIKVLEAKHMQELTVAPVNQWPQIKADQAREIIAAREGVFPILDRRSWAYPSLPETLHRLHQPILKATPYNLRRFAETPIPRRAINLVKNSVLALRWKISPTKKLDLTPEREKRIDIGTYNLEHPNNYDSWKTVMEATLEDFLTVGAGCLEPALTPAYKRPFKMWSVDATTIGIFGDWKESITDQAKYAQLTAMRGDRTWELFRADELLYIRDNIRNNSPFGLGRLEVCFNAILAFLGAQDAATKAGSDTIHKEFLWWRESMAAGRLETLKRYIRNEGEGQAKLNLVTGTPKPDILDMNPTTEADMLLNWQEFLIRIIATGFDISPMAVGIERDVNRNTGEVMDLKDFRTGVVPVAVKFAEAVTRSIFHKLLKWNDLEFGFIGLDDPDLLTKARLYQILYNMDATNANHIAEEFNLPKIEGGFGDLTFTQKQIMLIKAQALLGVAKGGSGSGGGIGAPGAGAPGSAPGAGGGGRGGVGNIPMVGSAAPMAGSIFSAEEVAQMNPDQVERLRQQQLIPHDPNQLKQAMDDNSPGILQKLSEEMQKYFEWLSEQEESDKVEPQKVSKKDEKGQMSNFRKQQKEFKKMDENKYGAGPVTRI